MKPWACCSMFLMLCLAVSIAWAGEKPDFNDPDAVLADMRVKVDGCSKAGNKCSVSCGYALKTLKNFLKANPGGDPSIMKQRWQPCFEAFRDAGLASKTAIPAPALGGSGGTLDFSDHAAVVAGIKGLQAKCAGDAGCEKACGYAVKSMKNFNHPQPHYAGLRKGKYESCLKKVPGMGTTASQPKTSFDVGKFIVAGVPLGGDMNTVKERLTLLKAFGYFKKSKKEYAELVLNRGKTSPGPDIVKNFEATIKEETVYVFFEATADGKVYKINFEQREPLDVDQVTLALKGRYGKPTKHQGNYLMWGCDKGPSEGFCVKANPSATGLTIWAFSEDVKKPGYATYDQNVLKAKGVKSGAKF